MDELLFLFDVDLTSDQEPDFTIKNLDSTLIKLNNQSIYIFDWDNTLLPTHFINNNDMTENNISKVKNLENIVFSILKKSKENGLVYIITNSNYKWFYSSCKYYYPSLYDWLSNIKILSSRIGYEKIYELGNWKINCMRDYLGFFLFDNSIFKNIICIGDSFEEHHSIIALSRSINHFHLKNIKFKDFPNIDDLKSQLEYFLSSIDFINNYNNNIYLKLGK